jgi:hypothetical protein
MVIVAVLLQTKSAGVNVYVVVAVLFTAGDHAPVTELLDGFGKVNEAPEQIAATCVNVGVTFGVTVMVIVAVLLQTKSVGVKVYVVVAKLLIAGVQVPATELLDGFGNAPNEAPEQTAATCVNNGVTFGVTVMVIVAVLLQTKSAGVNVYVVVAKLLIAGVQVPVTELLDGFGNAPNEAPEQTAATCVNVGVTFGVTVTVIVVVAVAHNPAVGVNV